MAEEIPGFDTDEELEQMLKTPVSELDEETRQEVQRYKARKLKAKRDAGVSEDRPDWWGEGMNAPTRADAMFDGAKSSQTEQKESTAEEEKPAKAEQEAAEETAAAEDEAVEQEPSPESEDKEPTGRPSREETPKRPTMHKKGGIPQIGWSSPEPPEIEGSVPEEEMTLETEAEQTAEQPEPPGEAEAEEQPAPGKEEAAEPEAEQEPEPAAEEAEPEEQPSEPAPAAGGTYHAGKFRIHVGPPPEDIPGFEADPELEELLAKDITSFEDEEQRQEIQLYRARKIKAMRDADIEPDESYVVSAEAPSETAEQPEPAEEAPEEQPEPTEAEEEPAEPEPKEEPEPAAEEKEPETAEEPEEETLDREELPEDPDVEELISAGMIDQEVEQEDGQGVFFTTVERKKALLKYTKSKKVLILHNFQIPTNVDDPEWRHWVEDALCKFAFQVAQENELEVIPQGSDISRGFLERHPEYVEQLKKSSPAYRRHREKVAVA